MNETRSIHLLRVNRIEITPKFGIYYIPLSNLEMSEITFLLRTMQAR